MSLYPAALSCMGFWTLAHPPRPIQSVRRAPYWDGKVEQSSSPSGNGRSTMAALELLEDEPDWATLFKGDGARTAGLGWAGFSSGFGGSTGVGCFFGVKSMAGLGAATVGAGCGTAMTEVSGVAIAREPSSAQRRVPFEMPCWHSVSEMMRSPNQHSTTVTLICSSKTSRFACSSP